MICTLSEPTTATMDHAMRLSLFAALDPGTRAHSLRVERLAMAFGGLLNLDGERRRRLAAAARYHDLGKLTFTPELLYGPGRLCPADQRRIHLHPRLGERLWREAGGDRETGALIRHHHERWDGRGYPDGLRGEAIPLMARLLAIADALDAMLSGRPYAPARSWAGALSQIADGAGTQFDPHLAGRIVEAGALAGMVVEVA